MIDRYYEGPVTDHFDGTRFFHPGLRASDKSLFDVLKWKVLGRRVRWPESVPSRYGIRPAARVLDLRITHIGHSSYLIQVDRCNILIDPVWAERASPFRRLGPIRHNPPAVAFADLPVIDVVLVTHNHYDHMDGTALSKLWKVHRPRIIAPLGNDTIMRSFHKEMEVQTGDWWQAFEFTKDLRFTIVPAYHWSSRSLRDNRMALWGGFVIETTSGVVYCAGDTAYRDGAIFPEIGRRFGPPLVAVLPIGAYSPRWFMETQHCNPEEAFQMARDCGAQNVLGVHWGTFALTDEPSDEPAERFTRLGLSNHLDGLRCRAMTPGDVWQVVTPE